MTDSMIWAGALCAVVTILAATASRGWRSWLAWKRFQLTARGGAETPELSPAVRIELAALKERLRKLEAIAQGVDP